VNILIVKTSAIGDVIHTLPALNCLRQHFPEAHITWLIEEAAVDIVQGHPALDRVLIARRKEWIRMWRQGQRLAALQQALRFAQTVRDTRYDLLIDFQNLLKSSIWVALAHAKRKIGYGRGMDHSEMSYVFLNEKIPAVSMDQHAVDRELQLLRSIKIDCKDVVFDLPISNGSRQSALDLLRINGAASGRPLVAINPMTTWPTKHWQDEKFALLADRLVDEGNTVVFTGGENDRQAIGNICAMMRHEASNLAGQTSLKELAALYGLANALVTTDTGPMHIAAAVGTPVVALFGPTAPWRTGPYGDKNRVIRLTLSCSPCLKRDCPLGTRACMKQIMVEDVVAAVKPLLSAPENGKGE